MISEGLAALTAGSTWTLDREIPLTFDAHHAQGMAFDGERYWVSSVDKTRARGVVFVLSSSFELLETIEVGDSTCFHPGGIDIAAGFVWLPSATYDVSGPTLVQRISIADGGLETIFSVDHHLGALCPMADSTIFSVDWGSRTLLLWSAEGELLAKKANPSHFVDWQDLQAVGEDLVACGGLARVQRSPASDLLWIGGLALVSTTTLEILSEVPFPGYSVSGLPATAEGFVLAEGASGLELTALPDGGFGPVSVWRQTG
ncbi:MAG: hypothetical protein JWL73_1972 [Actinomycetia bacterium]|nr:hypothetical protein [Actinomycetes bacterium]